MADWTRNQGATSQSPAGNTLTLSFGATVPSGHVVVGAILLNTGFTATLTDDKGNTYTVFDSHDDGSLYTAAFKSNTFLTNTPVTLTYTAHGTGTTGNFWVDQTDFAPPTGASTFNVDVSNFVANSAGTSFPTLTTTGSDELVYAVAFSSGTSTVGTGFTTSNGSGTAVFSEYAIQAAAGNITAGLATQTGSFWGQVFALTSGVSAALPPGQQNFGLPQLDRDTNAFPPNLRHWAAPDRNILIGQDTFPPGKREFQRPIDPQDSFAQWRTWQQTRNPNLSGLDIVPGKQLFDRPLDPQDSFAQWRSWTWQYRPLLIGQDAFPPGKQLFDRQPDPQDPFAQWRSFTWQFRPLLIGQDVLPPGRQLNYLPFGITWQPDSPPQNLLNTLLAPVVAVALPPGTQLYALPHPPLDTFAQWRTWQQTRNPNLAGQDAFPPGKQSYVLPPYGPPPLIPAWALFNINLYPPPAPPVSRAVYATYFGNRGMGTMMTNPGEKPS